MSSKKFLDIVGLTYVLTKLAPSLLPTQTGQSGKYLTTNGTSASWASVDALPSQTGQSGKFLTTNGTTASWETVSGGSSSFVSTTYTIDSTASTPQSYDIGTDNAFVWVFVDSVLAQSGVDYGIVGSTLTFTSILPVNTVVTIIRCVSIGSAVVIDIDSALSTTSENPVQNKVITASVNTLTSNVSTLSTTVGSHTSSISSIESDISTINTTLTTKANTSALASYLLKSGGTLTGALTFANNTWNPVGDDVLIGDYNESGCLGIMSAGSEAVGITFKNNSGTTLGKINGYSGYLNCSTEFRATSFRATSDSRFKKNKRHCSYDISSLKSYRYTLSLDNEKHIGLIAQDVKKVMPDAVREDEKGYLSLDYNAIVAVLVDKVNDQAKRIDDLEKMVLLLGE